MVNGFNPYENCIVVDDQGIRIDWISEFSLFDQKCSFMVNKS